MSNSDVKAKEACKKYLLNKRIIDSCEEKTEEGCDIVGYKNGEKYYFEVKSSSKGKKKAYCGTVMLTELNKAIDYKEHYKFIVCKGKGDNWDIHEPLFTIDEFMPFCALTTPILRYAFHPDPKKQPKFRESTKKANKELIKLMYQNFNEWKIDVNKPSGDTECKEYINECFDNAIIEANNEEDIEFNGNYYYSISKLVNHVVKYYVEKNPNITFTELKQKFPDSLALSNYGVFAKMEDIAKSKYQKDEKAYRKNPKDIIFLPQDNIKICTCNYWKKSQISDFVNNAKKIGLSIK